MPLFVKTNLGLFRWNGRNGGLYIDIEPMALNLFIFFSSKRIRNWHRLRLLIKYWELLILNGCQRAAEPNLLPLLYK
jgi:hypothetical protein